MLLVAPHLLFFISVLGVCLISRSLPLTLGVSAAFGAGALLTYRYGHSMNRASETAFGALGLVALVVYSGLTGDHLLHSLRNWLAFMLVLRTFRRMEKRDYAFCFLISAVLFVYVGQVYSDLPFLFLTLAYIIVGPYALFHFLARYGGFGAAAPEGGVPRLTRRQVVLMSSISLALIALVPLVFVLLPRANNPLAASALGTDDRVSGFAEDVRLGTFNRIVEQRDVVMSVRTDQPALWRGNVLDHYDGGVWRQTLTDDLRASRPTSALDEAVWRRTGLGSGAQPVPSKTVRRVFRIFDIRHTNNQLLSSGTIVSLENLGAPWWIRHHTIYSTLSVARDFGSQHGEYELVSGADDYLPPTELGYVDRPAPSGWQRVDERDLLLQISPDLPDRVSELAHRLTAGLSTNEEKAGAIETFLASSFTYSMQNLSSAGADPLEHFLFTSRNGHCEYFATAMAILLRCVGVPTRVIQGFAPGTFVDGQYVVQLSDAHLWTEVFVPGRGWRSYDPTPGQEARLTAGSRAGLWRRVRLKWQTLVLTYDGMAQTGFFAYVRAQLAAGMAALSRARRPLAWFAAWLAAAAGAVFLFHRTRGWRIASLFSWPGGPHRNRALRVRHQFGHYLRHLARRGYRRNPGTTPNELLAALERDEAPIIDEARLLTEMFYRTRFAGLSVETDEEVKTREALARVRRWAR